MPPRSPPIPPTVALPVPVRGGCSRALKQITYRCFDSPWQGKRLRPKGECVRILGINAVFHDSAAAIVVNGRTVAAAEEERFTRR